jgi:uncharacterized protein involved in exopolysaccharide biosynthesis
MALINQLPAILKARRAIVLATLLATMGLTTLVSATFPARWTADTVVLVDGTASAAAAGIALSTHTRQGYLATQADIIRSRNVALKVVDALKLEEAQTAQREWRDDTGGRGSFKVWLADRLLKNLEVTPAAESSVVRIAYSSSDPRVAAAAANAFAQAYAEASAELARAAAHKLPAPGERPDAAGLRAAALSDVGAMSTTVAVLSPAVEPLRPSFPRWSLSLAIALLLGAAAGICAALIVEVRDRVVRSEADVTDALGLPLTATLPHTRAARAIPTRSPTRLLAHRQAATPEKG